MFRYLDAYGHALSKLSKYKQVTRFGVKILIVLYSVGEIHIFDIFSISGPIYIKLVMHDPYDKGIAFLTKYRAGLFKAPQGTEVVISILKVLVQF